jgi:hypothetical protein
MHLVLKQDVCTETSDVDQLLYPADVLQAFACGWEKAQGTCYIPSEVCAHGREVLS